MTDININEVYEELKYLGDLPETSRLIKDYLALREKNREKNYEYSLKGASGRVSYTRFPDVLTARSRAIPGDTIVRREVGEWEEVKNDTK